MYPLTLRGISIGVWSEATTLDKVCATGGAVVNCRKIVIALIDPGCRTIVACWYVMTACLTVYRGFFHLACLMLTLKYL